MDKITNSLLESFTKQYELKSLSESVRFEHFCNYAITSKLNRSSFELEDIHTGSGNDCGIDGLVITINGKIINSIDAFTDIAEYSSYLDIDITFIQAKTSSSFDGSQLGNFIFGIKDFLSEKPALVQNNTIKELKELWELIFTRSDLMINRRPNARMYYVTTGRWVNDANLLAIIQNGQVEIEQFGIFEKTQIFPYGANEIQKLYHETKNKLSTTINFINRITLPDIKEVKEAYLGVIPFEEYIKLIQDENETIHSIFDDNVRDFQGDNEVNKKIKSTLENKKFDLFSVLNNGVTIVASSLTPAGNRFTLRDYQVVNGCQTSHVLHDCQKLEGVNNVFVPIKIVVTDSDEVKTDITLATNSQTEVKPEQLESLSLFQKNLELYFSSEKSLQLFYERRSQQYNSADIKKTQIISIPVQIKCFASMFLNSPHLVSAYYGTIVNRFKGQMFNMEHKLSPYYLSALCYYKIEQFFRSGELDNKFKKIRFHILMIARILTMGEEIHPLNSNKIEKSCEDVKKILLNDTHCLIILNLATKIIMSSGIEVTKTRYKAETETEMMLNQAKNFIKEYGVYDLKKFNDIAKKLDELINSK
ncbi:AIPR family protein [Enterobacter cancerogenus]|uniref:AIPR family protein n=1 Tax=Enterobacter cancerogenus TaxID=69218 RepID=UPI00380D4649